MIWRAGPFEFVFPRPALIMGIVNVTPDSFSDGGQFLDPAAAVARVQAQVSEGADLVDIGGESTRPGAAPVAEAEELRRVMPVLEALAGRIAIPVSIDTQKPAVARAALAAGASIVNDSAADRGEATMWRVVAAAGAGYVCMHRQGTPPTMQERPHYADVVREVDEFCAGRLQALAGAGVRREQVALDVGIGFGKNLEHNLQLLGAMAYFTKHARPLLLGASRKSFIGQLLGAPVSGRLPASLACACWAVTAGVQVIRTHDVAATWQAVRMTEALVSRRK